MKEKVRIFRLFEAYTDFVQKLKKSLRPGVTFCSRINNTFAACLSGVFLLFAAYPSYSPAEEELPPSEEITIARGLFNDGLYILAVKELERYAEVGVRKGEECTLDLLLGKSYYLFNRHEDAIRPLNGVLEKGCSFGQQEEAYYYLGDSFLSIGQRENSRKNLDRLQFLYPESTFIPAAREKLGEIHYLDGIELFDAQKYSKALASFEKALNLRPDSIPREELLVRIGDALFYLERYKEAEDAYGRAAAIYTEGEAAGRIQFQMAAIKYNLGEYDGAITDMNTFLEKYPDHPLYSRGRSTILWALYKLERYEDALNYLELLGGDEKNLTGKDVRDVMTSASRMLAFGDYSEAAGLLEKSLERFGEDPLRGEVMLLLAEAYGGGEKMEMERETYREVIARYPSSLSAQKSRYALGEIGFREGILTEAVRYFRSFLEEDSLGELADDARYYLAESLFLMGELEEAKRHFSMVTENFRDSKYRYRSALRIADIDMHAGRYSEAALRYVKIIKALPDKEREEELLWKTAEAFRRGGDFKAAAKVCRKYLKRYPEGEWSEDARVALGDMSYLSGDYSAGIEIFKKMIDADGKDRFSPRYALKLARGYLKLQDIPDAVSALDLIIERRPQSSEAATAYYLKGLAAQESGKYDHANKQYFELLERFPGTPLREDVSWRIGSNYYLLGKYEKALEAFKEFAREFPDSHRDSEGMVRKCYAAMGNFRRALEASKAFFGMNPDRAVDLKKRSEEAMALFEVGSYSDAIRVAEDIIEKSPAHTLSAKIMVLAGESSLKEGMRERAKEYFMMGRERLKEGPLKDLASFRLGEMAFEDGEFREGLVDLEKIGASGTFDDERKEELGRFIDAGYMMARSYYLKGEAYLNLNLDERALENFGRLVDEYPDLKGLEKEKLRAGLVLQQHKEYEEAISAMRQLIAISDDRTTKAEAQYWIGECYQYMGNVEQAIVEYLKVTYLYPSENMWALTARYMAAQAYQEAGEYEEAINLYKKVAEESEDKRKSEYARKRIEELMNRISERSEDE